MKDAINRHHKSILAEEATKGDLYFCPECKTPVILRSGENSTPYFAHPAYTGETLRDICPRFSKQSYKSSSMSATYATGEKVARSNFISNALRDGKLTPEEVEDMFMLVHSSYAEKVVLLERKEQELWGSVNASYQERSDLYRCEFDWLLPSIYTPERLLASWLHNSTTRGGKVEEIIFMSPESIVDLWLHLRGVDSSDIDYVTDHERPLYKGKEVYIPSNDPTLKFILKHVIKGIDNNWKDVSEEHTDMFLHYPLDVHCYPEYSE